MISFPDWLRLEREKRGWSQAQLGEYSGLGRSIINKLESASQHPTLYNAICLSDALGIAPESILRAAKLLPPRKDNNVGVQMEDIDFLLKQLTPDEQEEIRQIIELKIERRKKAEQAERAKGFKPRRAG